MSNYKSCLEACKGLQVACPNTSCRKWINYEEEYNCVLYTVEQMQNSNTSFTLRDVAKRLNCSFVRVKQIEDEALKKLEVYQDVL